jgi:cytochrome bd ubiquinol oxidase subunit II
MSAADAVVVVLWIVATLYAVLAGADFGAGFWDLIAGGAERGERPRALIDRVLTPVWEANHVWLIFMLVLTWTGFPDVFAAIVSTLYLPLLLAALGIVLRGSGFAFRHVARGLPSRRVLGATFALSSLFTPFFMGTVVGAIAGGRVPADGDGDRISSWLNLPAISIGVLMVVMGAYLAAVFLVSDARRSDDRELEAYFRRRALASAVVAGAVAFVALLAMHADARYLYDGLTDEALPLVLISAVCGTTAIVLIVRGSVLAARPVSVAAAVAVVWGWGVAQYPYLLPGELTLDAAAAPGPTLTALLVISGAAVVVVGPAMALLLRMSERSELKESPGGGRKAQDER